MLKEIEFIQRHFPKFEQDEKWITLCEKSHWDSCICRLAAGKGILTQEQKRRISKNNPDFKFLGMSSSEIRAELRKTGKYDTKNKNYFIAQGVTTVTNNKNYKDGLDYRINADYDCNALSSFGMIVWDGSNTSNFNTNRVLKVKVPYNAVAVIFYDNEVRVNNLHVMHEVGKEDYYEYLNFLKKKAIRRESEWLRANKPDLQR